MKKILTVFGLLLIFSACSTNDDSSSKSSNSDKETAVKNEATTDTNTTEEYVNVMSGYANVPEQNVFVGVDDNDVQSMLDNNETFYLYFGRPT